jgi:adenosylmethionine-8-amino-7-oxononanoate aminotransferase
MRLARLDRQFIWHPFTQMKEWLEREPIVIVSGRGAVLRDDRGREFLDANSSIWTNLHGHNHPQIDAALRRQLGKIAHSSALGLANEPAALLAATLVEEANAIHDLRFMIDDLKGGKPRKSSIVNHKLEKVFFSDDGSTAMEVALKLAYEFARRTGRSRRPKFLSLGGAYHGDTVGAVSLGHVDLFHRAYAGLLFKTDQVMSPYCYRCPFNRAKPDRADARDYRKCQWECIGLVEKKFAAQKKRGNPYAAFVFEPLMQGAAGMIPQPRGWLRRAAEIARGHGALLVADEVMTGFGRCGVPSSGFRVPSSEFRILRPRAGTWNPEPGTRNPELLFASHHEGVQPDFLALAKGLTGGYLPMAATLTTQEIFDAFLGRHDEFKTFFHGHSYTANQLGAAAALASLDLLRSKSSVRARQRLERDLHDEMRTLWTLPNVGDIRQAGLVAGVELVRDWRTREPFDLRERIGVRVCEAMAKRGVLTRPIGDVIVLMPPFCTTTSQLRKMVGALREAIEVSVRSHIKR